MAPQKDLFPSPSRPLSALFPTQWAGSTPASLVTLQHILKDNHTRWHIFFNDDGFHNHITHHVLALWSLGADPQVIQAAYEQDGSRQRPAFPSPELITDANFNDHLGDEKYYSAYRQFFTDSIQEKDIGAVLDEYVFSPRFNFGSKSSAGKHPEMLNRFVGGLLHPMIHCGYGVEFGLPCMIVEGLAQAAVHEASLSVLIPPSILPTGSPIEKVTSTLNSLRTDDRSHDTHAFTILARVIKDSALVAPETTGLPTSELLQNHGERLFEHAQGWTLDTSKPKEVERKIEELQWLNTLIYAIPGINKGKGEYQADFFSMHLVTSSLFLPGFAAYLSPESLEALLRAYMALCLAIYVVRGKPALEIESFFAEDSGTLPDLSAGVVPPKLSLVPTLPSINANPNPWISVMQKAIVHPDEHLCKFQRAVAHYSTLYGSRPAGFFSETELPGSDKIDGSLFIRAAVLTQHRLGRDRGGEKILAYWDFEGF